MLCHKAMERDREEKGLEPAEAWDSAAVEEEGKQQERAEARNADRLPARDKARARGAVEEPVKDGDSIKETTNKHFYKQIFSKRRHYHARWRSNRPHGNGPNDRTRRGLLRRFQCTGVYESRIRLFGPWSRRWRRRTRLAEHVLHHRPDRLATSSHGRRGDNSRKCCTGRCSERCADR